MQDLEKFKDLPTELRYYLSTFSFPLFTVFEARLLQREGEQSEPF